MMQKPADMRALVWTGPYQASLERIERPSPHGDEIELKVLATGVCGSDLHGFRGHSSVRVPPLVLGHEVVGSDAAGSVFVVNPLVGCKRCRLCASGWPNLCPNRGLLGLDRSGSFAEYVAVPSENLTTLPEGMTLAMGTLAEPLATPVNALSALDVRETVVAVIGAGTIGLLTAYAAKELGAGFVAVYDLDRSRLMYAKRHANSVGTCTEDILPALLDVSDGLGADIVVDAVGVESTWAAAVALVRAGGVVAVIGLGAESGAVSLAATVRKGISIRGVYAYTPTHFAQALAMLDRNPPSVDWTSEASIDDGPELLGRLAEGKGPVKAIFTF